MSGTTGIPVHKWQETKDPAGSFKLESFGLRRQDLESLHPHRHDYYEIMCFISGTFVHDIDFVSFESNGNEFHFVQANSIHMMVREESAEGVSLMFSADFVEAQLLRLLPFGTLHPVIRADAAVFEKMLNLLQLMKEEYEQKSSGYLQIIRNYFHALLWQIARSNLSPSINLPSGESDLYSKFTGLLQLQAVQLRTVEKVADVLSVSAKHLIEVVKKQSGLTPLQHIHEQMLTESKRMLFHSEIPIKEIAYTLGFTDSINFSKWFRSKTGYSPGAYRQTEGK